MSSSLIIVTVAVVCISLLLAVLGLAVNKGFIKRRAKYNQTLPETTIYHYVRNCYVIQQNGANVTIRPRYRTNSKARQTGWGTVLSKKRRFTFFYRGRTGSGASYDVARKELDSSMQVVVIKGSDFQKFLHGRTIYTRWKDRAIASPYGYTGPATIHQVHLGEDRSKLDDSHL